MRISALILIASLTLAACGSAVASTPTPPRSIPADISEQEATTPVPTPEVLPDPSASTTAVEPDLINPRVEDFDAFVPPRLIGPDGIRPIYEPRFVAAENAPLEDDELVIGIAIDGEAKAYPITVLRFREMVNDELADLPILVTW